MDVAQGIITNGLGGNAANMILGHFHLGFFDISIIVPEQPTIVGGGGSAWPDQTKQWEDDAPRSIIIRVTYKKKTIERIYLVSSKRAEFIISVSNFISDTRDRFKVKVSNMKRKMIEVFTKFKN